MKKRPAHRPHKGSNGARVSVSVRIDPKALRSFLAVCRKQNMTLGDYLSDLGLRLCGVL